MKIIKQQLMIVFIQLSLINTILGLVTYDSGFFSGFSSSCNNGYTETQTISFNGIFENVPQVILGLEYLDTYYPANFKIEVLDVQKTSFGLKILCESSVTLWTIKYSWYAIDDSRIQVINNFNMLNVDDKTFDHLNANANFGILSLVSMGMQGNIDFKLSISSITTTQVTVGITKVDGKFVNLNQIGYQIILGIEEAFLNTQVLHHTSYYSSGTLTQQSNRWLFLAYNGVQLGASFRQKSIRTSVSQSFTVETWYGTYVVNDHLSSWVAYQFTTVFKAFECFTLRISQSLDMEVLIKPQIYVDISEINQSFSSSTSLIIQKTQNLLNFKIYMKCIKTKRIASQFLKCQNCSTYNKYYKFKHYCHGQIDAVTYYPRFQISGSVYKELNINILADKITITQILFNQIQSTQTLIEIQIQD